MISQGNIDRITDFDAVRNGNVATSQDYIELSGFGITAANFAQHVAITDVGTDTLVTIDGDPAPPPTTTVRTPLPTTTFEAPAPPGTKVALGNGWSVVVRGFNPDSTRALQPLNRDSPPLEKGQRRVMVDVEMTYLDGRAAAQAPFDGVDLAVLGDDGRLITPADTPCVPSAPTLDQSTELSRGATVRGRLCFAVDAAVVPTLRLVAEPSMTFGSEPSYLALLKRQA